MYRNNAIQQIVFLSQDTAPDVTVRCRTFIPIEGGGADFCTFNHLSDPGEHIAMIFAGTGLTDARGPLVRIHSECLTGDIFGSYKCDCGPQLNESRRLLGQQGGILLYLRQEGRGIGLYNKLDAYELQNHGLDTFAANLALHLPADGRDYRVAADMLKALSYPVIRLLTNNPDKAVAIRAQGVVINEVIPTGTYRNPHNRSYLNAKIRLHQHTLSPQRNEESND